MLTQRVHLTLTLVSLTLAPCLLAMRGSINAAPVVFAGSTDIGNTQKGSSAFDSASGTYRVSGGGQDMWGSHDDFHLAWMRLAGDATLSAEIELPPAGSVHPKSKGVLIFRQSLDTGSPYADIAIHGDGHITEQFRAEAGSNTEDVTAPDTGSRRLRIERRGNRFTAFTGSADGKWTAFSSATVILDGPLYVGLGVCSHNADGLVTVGFRNVVVKQEQRTSSLTQR